MGREALPHWSCGTFSLGLRIVADMGQAQAHSTAHTQAAVWHGDRSTPLGGSWERWKCQAGRREAGSRGCGWGDQRDKGSGTGRAEPQEVAAAQARAARGRPGGPWAARSQQRARGGAGESAGEGAHHKEEVMNVDREPVTALWKT